MGKLPAESIAAAKDAEAWVPSEGGELWPIGKYVCLLAEVTTEQGREYEYWNLRFQAVKKYDQPGTAGSVWDMISHSPKSARNQKALFQSFGYKVDSDPKEFVNGGDDGTDFAWVFIGHKNREDREGNVVKDDKGNPVKKAFVKGYMPIREDDELPPLAE